VRQTVAPVLLTVIGAVVLQQVGFGNYLDYVKPSQGPLLVAAGVLLVAGGIAGIIADLRRTETTEPPAPRRRATIHTHGPLRADPAVVEQVRREDREHHDHSRTPAVGWLLILPVFLVLMVPPPALGAYAALRAGAAVPQPVTARVYTPLNGSDPVPLAVHDYAERAAWDHGATLTGHTVRLTGFVTPEPGGGWYLTRMVISCCAADSRGYLVEVVRSATPPVANSWQQVTGTYAPGEPAAQGGGTARIRPIAITPVDQPRDPYELP
jgi:uncharacterized repeat protein (TIGR03943 family)